LRELFFIRDWNEGYPIGSLHVHGAQDGGHYPDHTLAPFVHEAKILRLRLLFVHTVVIIKTEQMPPTFQLM
jgi:hypothetical protein